ncbi:MAG: hypothetical protein AMXMBFR31_08820 [Candidatus Desulfobacillus denitrificans]
MSAEILAALADLRAEVRQLRDLLEKRAARPRDIRMQRRHKAIRELGQAAGLGPTWSCARAVLGIIDGTEPVPEGLAALVARLRKDDETPTTTKTIYRILCDHSHDFHPVEEVAAPVISLGTFNSLGE